MAKFRIPVASKTTGLPSVGAQIDAFDSEAASRVPTFTPANPSGLFTTDANGDAWAVTSSTDAELETLYVRLHGTTDTPIGYRRYDGHSVAGDTEDDTVADSAEFEYEEGGVKKRVDFAHLDAQIGGGVDAIVSSNASVVNIIASDTSPSDGDGQPAGTLVIEF